MAKLSKTTDFTFASPEKETPLDKTTRIVRRINEDEADVRHQKAAHLRKVRFESEAETHDAKIVAVPSKARKKP
ncbi:hypothetical protein [Yoonia sp. MH D7]